MQGIADNININTLWRKLLTENQFTGYIICGIKNRFKEVSQILQQKVIFTTENTDNHLEMHLTSYECVIINRKNGSCIKCRTYTTLENCRGWRAKIALIDYFPPEDVESVLAPRCETIGYLDF